MRLQTPNSELRTPNQYSETVPIQYEEGKTCFMGIDIKVDSRVLIPRPETELLVSTVVDRCKEKGLCSPRILEIGTGSAAIPIGLVRSMPECEVVAADISEDALEVARENVSRNNAGKNIELCCSDMFSSFGVDLENGFDCIVSNPPYVSRSDYEKVDAWVKAEPRIALYAGEEGMDYLNVIADEGIKYIKPGGFVALEVGYDQSQKVKDRLLAGGFSDVDSFKDFNGYERVIVGWKNG